jgi:hypothetical protein
VLNETFNGLYSPERTVSDVCGLIVISTGRRSANPQDINKTVMHIIDERSETVTVLTRAWLSE